MNYCIIYFNLPTKYNKMEKTEFFKSENYKSENGIKENWSSYILY